MLWSVKTVVLIASDKILNDETIALPEDILRLFFAFNKSIRDFLSRLGAVSKLLHGEATTKVNLVQVECNMDKRAQLEDMDPSLI